MRLRIAPSVSHAIARLGKQPRGGGLAESGARRVLRVLVLSTQRFASAVFCKEEQCSNTKNNAFTPYIVHAKVSKCIHVPHRASTRFKVGPECIAVKKELAGRCFVRIRDLPTQDPYERLCICQVLYSKECLQVRRRVGSGVLRTV